MAAIRHTTHPLVFVDCPLCGDPLPRIAVDVDARHDGPRSLRLHLEVQELDAAWWNEARLFHPDCVPPGGGRR